MSIKQEKKKEKKGRVRNHTTRPTPNLQPNEQFRPSKAF